MVDTVVSYQGNLRCRAEHPDSGSVVFTDAPKDNQGQAASFSPSEMLSISLGSCILSIMNIAARSLNTDIAGATATITKDMANSPRRITGIAVTVSIPGFFNEGQMLEAAAHACPVHNVLEIDVPITINWTG